MNDEINKAQFMPLSMMKKALTVLIFILPLLVPGSSGAICTVSATGVNFGSVDMLSPAPYDSTGTVIIFCDDSPPPLVTISLSTGMGTFAQRTMKRTGSEDYLNYNVYTDTARTTVWGDGSGGTVTFDIRAKKNKDVIATIYGRIPVTPFQNVPTGLYADTLTVTIVW